MKRMVEIGGREQELEYQERNSHIDFRLGDYSGSASVLQVEPGTYSVLVEGRSYNVRVTSDGNGGWLVDLCGKHLPVSIRDPRAMSGKRGAPAGGGRLKIATSMPGKVIRVLATAGAEVAEGQGLVVVEAMKMQNEIKAPRAGVVQEIRAVEGATVADGEALLFLE